MVSSSSDYNVMATTFSLISSLEGRAGYSSGVIPLCSLSSLCAISSSVSSTSPSISSSRDEIRLRSVSNSSDSGEDSRAVLCPPFNLEEYVGGDVKGEELEEDKVILIDLDFFFCSSSSVDLIFCLDDDEALDIVICLEEEEESLVDSGFIEVIALIFISVPFRSTNIGGISGCMCSLMSFIARK